MTKLRLMFLVLVMYFGQAQAQNLIHFGIRLEVNLTVDRPQWQNAVVGLQFGMAFKVANESAMLGFRIAATGNPELLRLRVALDTFAHLLMPNNMTFIYAGLGVARGQIVAASYWDVHALLGLQLPLGAFIEITFGLGFTNAFDFSQFPPSTKLLGPLFTFQMVFGWWKR
jgi:hypothetical protein